MKKLDLTKLNSEQKKAVLKTEGAVLVTAGAGSGKTRVLTHRIAHLIENGVSPYQILAVTFTNKAAAEMKERIAKLLENVNTQDMWVFTFHSLCVKLLRQNKNIEKFSGYTTNFSIYDSSDRERILKTLIAERKIEDDSFLEKVNWHISNFKNKNMQLSEYVSSLPYHSSNNMLGEIMVEYEKKMQASNALDFDSLLTYTYRLLFENQDILEYYQNKFEYIHIDEFQDTNKVQYDLVKLLSNKHKNVFVVGDEDQCIYSWRGADSSHIFAFCNDFAPVEVIKLEQNYRSTKKIIELANKVIKNNSSRLEKVLWSDKDEGVRVEYSSQFNERYEASFVAEQIYNLVRSGSYEYKDIAVLMRLNALTRHLEEKCLEFNIPYRVFGGMKFYDRAEIKNVLAYLKLLVNPRDNASFNRVINFPKRGIGESALLQLKQVMRENESPFEAIMRLNSDDEISSAVLNKFLSFQALMKSILEKMNAVSHSEFIEYVLDMAGINEAYGSGSEEDLGRLYNLSELISSLKEFEKVNSEAKLEEYLQSVSLTTDVDSYDENKNVVTLATVHSVKGLEFKVVFIIGAEEKTFPIMRSGSTEKDIEEERRLMYVAITRAEERLYITNAKERFLYGTSQFTVPSRFLKEADLVKEKQPLNSNPFLNSSYSGNYNSGYSSGYNSGFGGNYSSNRNDIITPKEPIKTSSINADTTKVEVKDLVTKLKTNDRVSHPKFGVGVVLSISGTLDTKTATIHFEGFGTKILALNFAPLTIL